MTIAPDLSTIREAQVLLRNYFGVTPLVKARSLARADGEAWLKIETGLPTGSFKPRGALFGLATAMKRENVEEVTACSTGNHGAAVAFAAKTLGRFQPQFFCPRIRIRSSARRLKTWAREL